VRNEYRLPVRQLHDETLMPRLFAVVGQQPDYITRILDPLSVIAFAVRTSDFDVSLP
jgi:hypothetical protein